MNKQKGSPRSLREASFAPLASLCAGEAGLAPIYILLGLLIGVVILLVPIPYYRGQIVCDPPCFKDCPPCPQPGWHLGEPIWKRVIDYFVYVNKPDNVGDKMITISASPTPSTSAKTANWKTYTNEKLNISIKYPPIWELSEAKDVQEKYESFHDVFYLKPKIEKDKVIHNGITFRYYGNSKRLSIIDFEKEFGINVEGRGNCGIYLPDDVPVKNNNGVNGFYRAKGVCEPLEAEFYNWAYDDKIFQFIDSKWFNAKDDQLLEQIFSTVQFLDQNQVNVEFPPLYSKVEWTETTVEEKYPFRTENLDFVTKKGTITTSIVYPEFPDNLVEGFRDYYIQWLESRGWKQTWMAGGSLEKGSNMGGLFGYEKNGRHFEFGVPGTIAKDSRGQPSHIILVIHD